MIRKTRLLFMKVFFFLFLVFFLISCTRSGLPPEEELTKCSVDEDCALVSNGCCSCAGGGERVSINKEYSSLWNKVKLKDCEDSFCLAMISNSLICHSNPKCINHKCSYLPKPEFLKGKGPIVLEDAIRYLRDDPLLISFAVVEESHFARVYSLEYTIDVNISSSKKDASSRPSVKVTGEDKIFKNEGVLVHEFEVTKGNAKKDETYIVKIVVRKTDGTIYADGGMFLQVE